VTWGSDSDVRARRGVQGLLRVLDPSGTRSIGAFRRPETLRSPRAIGGFEAGALGFGHIVLAVDDYEESLRFYRDGLGLRVSDFIELDMGSAGRTTVAFFHAGPRHHSLAIAQFPAPKRLHHFMLQVRDFDDVGSVPVSAVKPRPGTDVCCPDFAAPKLPVGLPGTRWKPAAEGTHLRAALGADPFDGRNRRVQFRGAPGRQR
jgi:catechol 2,3-dioxygenase-like lactoylglutathione lyase family enzyme